MSDTITDVIQDSYKEIMGYTEETFEKWLKERYGIDKDQIHSWDSLDHLRDEFVQEREFAYYGRKK